MTLDLGPIQARHQAATAGLWWNDGHEIYAGPTGIPAASVWIGETCDPDLPDGGNANGTFMANAKQDMADLLAEVERLRTELEQARQLAAREEREMTQIITERDHYHDMADQLAAAIAPIEVIGEHSAGNCPWQNALDHAAATAR